MLIWHAGDTLGERGERSKREKGREREERSKKREKERENGTGTKGPVSHRLLVALVVSSNHLLIFALFSANHGSNLHVLSCNIPPAAKLEEGGC